MKKIKLTQVAIPTNRAVKTFSGERVYVATGDLDGTKIKFNTIEKVSFENKPSRANQETQIGDVIFAKMQATDKSLVIDEENSKHIYSSGFFVLRLTNEIIPKYLYHFLRSKSFHTQKDKNCSGATQKAITLDGLKKIQIPLPSLEIQKSIVVKLDKLTELIDLKKEAIGKTEELTKSVFLEMFGDLTLNEKGWTMVNMKDICHKITDGTHQPPKFTTMGIPFIFVQNMIKGTIDFSNTKFISRETYENLTRNTKIEKNDIIYSSVGSFGVAVEISSEKEFAFQRHIAHIKPDKSKILSSFLVFQMNTDFIFSQAKKVARGAAQPTINLGDIRLFKVALPELSLQEQFLNIFQKNQCVIEDQKQSLQKIQELYDTTVQEIFSF